MKMLSVALIALGFGFQAQAVTIEQMFDGTNSDSPACYMKIYDRAHLASHPRQTVRQIKIKLAMTVFEASPDMEPLPILSIQVKRKNENKTWTNNISCTNNRESGTVYCGVDCDGGSVEILKHYSDGSIKLRNNGVILYGGCGEDVEEAQTIFLESKKNGDDIFNLPAVDPSVCNDVSNEAH